LPEDSTWEALNTMAQTDHKKTNNPYSPDFRKRAVQLATERRDEYPSQTVLLNDIANKMGCSANSLRIWVRQAQCENGNALVQTRVENARIKELEREVSELRQANEMLKKVAASFMGA
jgi:transposase